MTKTPEELTADWKKGLLESGLYYVGNDKVKDFAFVKPHEISVYTLDSNIPMLLKDNAEILAPVPTYDEYKAMQEHIAAASKTIEKLQCQLAEHKENCCCLENEVLRLKLAKIEELLKECKEAYQAYIPLFLMLRNKDAADCANKLLNRINEVLDN